MRDYIKRNGCLEKIIKVLSVILIALIILSCLWYAVSLIWLDYKSPETIEGKVVDTYIKRYGDGDYFHIAIELSDGSVEIFQNRDAWFIGKYNSADVQQTIVIGETYIFEVRGVRIPHLSKFRNIVKATIKQ